MSLSCSGQKSTTFIATYFSLRTIGQQNRCCQVRHIPPVCGSAWQPCPKARQAAPGAPPRCSLSGKPTGGILRAEITPGYKRDSPTHRASESSAWASSARPGGGQRDNLPDRTSAAAGFSRQTVAAGIRLDQFPKGPAGLTVRRSNQPFWGDQPRRPRSGRPRTAARPSDLAAPVAGRQRGGSARRRTAVARPAYSRPTAPCRRTCPPGAPPAERRSRCPAHSRKPAPGFPLLSGRRWRRPRERYRTSLPPYAPRQHRGRCIARPRGSWLPHRRATPAPAGPRRSYASLPTRSGNSPSAGVTSRCTVRSPPRHDAAGNRSTSLDVTNSAPSLRCQCTSSPSRRPHDRWSRRRR